jgi:class 3 adenylate cyclase
MKISEQPRLNRALNEYVTSKPEERRTIEERMWNTFGTKQCVVVIDMANFSLVTHKHGIIYYLSLIHTMQKTVEHKVSAYDGVLIQFLADNAFFIIDDVNRAVECLMDINQTLQKLNQSSPQMWDVEICAGVCFGEFLNVNGNDIFGEPVNIASRLGEDLAGPWQVLLSSHAMRKLSDSQKESYPFKEVSYSEIDDPVFSLDCKPT